MPASRRPSPDSFPYATHLDVRFPPLEKIALDPLVAAVRDSWYNQTLARVNESVVRLGVMQGEYHWHEHTDDDEFFFVLDGRFLIDLEPQADGVTPGRVITLGPREGLVVPKGVRHRTRAPERAVILMVETAGIIPTGSESSSPPTSSLAPMRKQYYFRPSSRGLLAWDVDRLVALSAGLSRKRIPLTEIRELDEPWSGDGHPVTWRAILEHVKLIDEADLSFPIILSANGEVMDGRHRIAKAFREGRAEIEAVQFAEDPEPDQVGREPDDLPYD
jgi:mannose-6-phosphate isomerase-like protein (cupin superfamily)